MQPYKREYYQMKSKRETTVLEKEKAVARPTSLFDRENVLWMIAGAAAAVGTAVGILVMKLLGGL